MSQLIEINDCRKANKKLFESERRQLKNEIFFEDPDPKFLPSLALRFAQSTSGGLETAL